MKYNLYVRDKAASSKEGEKKGNKGRKRRNEREKIKQIYEK